MLPLRDDIPSRRFPVVTLTLIGLNVLAFLWELRLGPRLQDALLLLGIVPVRYTSPDVAALFTWGEQALPFLSSMFLHGGWTHLLGNLWTLWIFGDNVEDRLGKIRFVFFYFLCGIAANLTQTLVDPASAVPTIGASGAISGVLGSYLAFFPRARILTLIPLFLLFPIIEIPAVFFLVLWFIFQLQSGALALFTAGTGIAWWAHIGGFVAGFALARIIKP